MSAPHQVLRIDGTSAPYFHSFIALPAREAPVMYEVNLNDAAKQLHPLVNKAEQGEDVVITRGDVASFKIVLLSKVKPRPTFGSAKGGVWMSEDFDEPLDDVEDDMPS